VYQTRAIKVITSCHFIPSLAFSSCQIKLVTSMSADSFPKHNLILIWLLVSSYIEFFI